MIVGFTGTQVGMTDAQVRALSEWIDTSDIAEVHHGDCVGADQQFHEIVRLLKPDAKIHIHPPTNSSKRAFCSGDVLDPPRDYLDRNQDIVDACDTLLATPKEMTEQLRSGTWATIRRARKAGKTIVYFLADYRDTSCD